MTHNYGGVLGILGAAGVVFFAFIGFDAVSTAAQEARNPKRDMPIGILGSLVVCTLLYVAFSYVLSGVATVQDFRTVGREASVAYAIRTYMHGYEWLSKFVTVAILFGFSSVILVMLLGQSRVFYSMANDGLVPKVFADIHPTYQTPWKSNILFFFFTALFGAFMPENVVGEMTSIGTLFAFMLVCAGVWVMRVRRPDVPRGFIVPALPLVAVLGIVVCGSMIFGLGWTNWVRLAYGWSSGSCSTSATGGRTAASRSQRPRPAAEDAMVAGAGLSLSQEDGAPHATEDGRSRPPPVGAGRRAAPAGARDIAGGTVGYVLVEGWSWWDAFYMTVITVTTVGYREVHSLSRAGEVLTVLVLVAGVGTAFYAFTLIATIVVEGGLARQFRRRRMDRMIDELEGHFILCGFGRIGSVIADEFRQQDIPFVIVERDAERVQEALDRRHARRRGRRQPRGGPARLNIDRARGLVAAVGTDAENVYTILTARVLAPGLFIVGRAESEDAERKLRRAGADRVVLAVTSARSRWRRRRSGPPSSTS